jgi:hypothetical protein
MPAPDSIDLTEFPTRGMLRFTDSRSTAKGSLHVSIRGRVVAEAVRDRIFHRPDDAQDCVSGGPDEEAPFAGGAGRQWQNQVAGAEPHGSRSRNRTAANTDIRAEPAEEEEEEKEGRNITADQLEIRDFRLSTTRLEPGARADGVVLFDRPNYKQSSEKLFLQIAQADKVDQPVLIRLPFTPPVAGDGR